MTTEKEQSVSTDAVPKIDKRKGNSGRKKSDDPTIHCQFYIKTSVVKGMGGMKNLRAFVYRVTAEEAKARVAKKQAK